MFIVHHLTLQCTHFSIVTQSQAVEPDLSRPPSVIVLFASNQRYL